MLSRVFEVLRIRVEMLLELYHPVLIILRLLHCDLVTVTHIVLSLNHGSQETRQGKEDYTSRPTPTHPHQP
jgi:hypothetical protein